MIIINNLRSTDASKILATSKFLEDNQDQKVRFRGPREIDRAIRTSQCILIELDGNVCGCSFIYKFTTTNPRTIFTEIGTVKIIKNGLGLMQFVIKLHLVHLYLEEYTNPTRGEVFSVVAPQTESEHILLHHAHFKRWQITEELSKVRSATGVPFTPDKYAVAADDGAVEKAFDDLKNWHRGSTLFRTPKGNEEIRVDLGWFHPDRLSAFP